MPILNGKLNSLTEYCLKENGSWVCLFFCSLSITNNLAKEFFSNLAQNLIEKLPIGQNKFDINSVWEFYWVSCWILKKTFHFTKVAKKSISDFLKELKTNKATWIDNPSGCFLKDKSKFLATPVVQICNLCIKLSMVPVFWWM